MYFVVSHLPQMEAQIVTEPQLCELLITVHNVQVIVSTFQLQKSFYYRVCWVGIFVFIFYFIFFVQSFATSYSFYLSITKTFFFCRFCWVGVFIPPPLFFFYNQETLENIMYIILVFCCFFKTDIVSKGQQVLHVVKHSWCCAYCSSLM